MELNKTYNEDCLLTIARMEDNSVDLTVTSPPYDKQRMYNGFVFDFERTAQGLYRVTKEGGVVVWIVNDSTVDGSESLTTCKQKIFFREECGFNIHDTMIWNKPNFSNPSKNRYHQTFEYMFILSKGKPKTFNPIKDKKNKYLTCLGKNSFRQTDGTMSERKKNVGSEFGMRTNVWQGNTRGQEEMCVALEHPAMMPKWIARDHIITWSNEGDLVYDPFSGSGTVTTEAHLLNRKWIASEISGEYYELDLKKKRKELGVFNLDNLIRA